jgi:hypothetical protein
VATSGSNVPPAGTFDPILLESNVDVRACLQSSVPVVYPAAARAAEIEADVLLELVVTAHILSVSRTPPFAPCARIASRRLVTRAVPFECAGRSPSACSSADASRASSYRMSSQPRPRAHRWPAYVAAEPCL